MGHHPPMRIWHNKTQIGSKIKVHWSAEEIGDMGWTPGWYVATVQKYCQDTDMLTVTYSSEPVSQGITAITL